MRPGGFDNSPLVQKLMEEISPLGGPFNGGTISFPPLPGHTITIYYFSQPLIISRAITLDCKTNAIGGYGGVYLAFPPGIDGVIQESGQLSQDGGWGNSIIQGCHITSLGGGGGSLGVYATAGVTINTGGSGYTGSGTLTEAGGYCSSDPPVLNATTSGGAITSVTIAHAGSCNYDPSGVQNIWASGGGLSAGTGFSILWTSAIAINPGNKITGIYLNANFDGWSNGAWTFPSDCPQSPYGNECAFGVGDGILATGKWITDQIAVPPGDYVTATDPIHRTVTLAQPVIVSQTNSAAGKVWDLPFKERYLVTTTTGNNVATVLSGPNRAIKSGDMVWSDAFVYGSTVVHVDNVLVGTPTVNTGGSGYVGTSGTMTWNGIWCHTGYSAPPVINVTASGGVITGVTSIANPGNCLGGTPPSGAANWTAGGGLSGGVGASFNTTFNQHLDMRPVTMYGTSPALVTHTSGSPGQLWTLPAAVIRRDQARLIDSAVSEFVVGLRMDCHSDMQPLGGCNDSFDERNTYSANNIGRLVRGNNAGVSTSIGNTYGANTYADIVEAASIGSTYISESNNSQDSGSSAYGTLVGCGGQNFSVLIGMYLSGQAAGPCMGVDAQGNENIGVPANSWAQPSELFLGSIYGLGTISAGTMGGPWAFGGGDIYPTITNTTTTSGNVINVQTSPVLYPGMLISDITHPNAIPAGTTVTEIGGTSVRLSHNVTGGGVQAGDTIYFTNTASRGGPCVNIIPGVNATGANGMLFDNGCAHGGLGIAYAGSIGGWSMNTILWPDDNYVGYNGDDLRLPVFHNGLQMGNGSGNYWGQERNLDSGASPPYNSWHLQGDTRINQKPVPGGNLAWTNIQLFATSLSANIAAGATSVTVASCPTLPAGTPVIDETGVSKNFGQTQLSQPLGTMNTCAGTTLTLQAGAANAGNNGDTIQFLGFRAAGTISNDPYGFNWPVATNTDIATLLTYSPCGGVSSLGLGVVYNGPTAAVAGYNAPVSAGQTGGTVRLVFCDATSWTYH
jgi:hypothetical protein